MDHDEREEALNAAMERLAGFRASWKRGDQICAVSGLMADDIDLILAHLAGGVPAIRVRNLGTADG